jgi:hypothetical protein
MHASVAPLPSDDACSSFWRLKTVVRHVNPTTSSYSCDDAYMLFFSKLLPIMFFFLPHSLSFIEICDDHLKFQGSLLSCTYLSVDPYFFLFVCFFLGPPVGFFKKKEFAIQSIFIIFCFFNFGYNSFYFLIFFLVPLVNIQLLSISSFDKTKTNFYFVLT